MEPPPPTPDSAPATDTSKFTPLSVAIGSGLWLLLIYGVYVRMPHLHEVFLDFGVPLPAASSFVLDYAPLVLPLIGMSCAALVGVSRSRHLTNVALLWIPLAVIVALLFLIGGPLIALIQSLT